MSIKFAVVAECRSDEDGPNEVEVEGWFETRAQADHAAIEAIKEDVDHAPTLVLKIVGRVEWPATPEPFVVEVK